jgi:glycosyltransferase-like protein LARGE
MMTTGESKAGLSKTSAIIFLSMLVLCSLLSLNNTLIIDEHNGLNIQKNLQPEHGCQQEEVAVGSVLPPLPPFVRSDLLNLYETIPNSTSTTLHPRFREVSYVFPHRKEVPFFHITLTTQLSVSKLPRLLQLLERWRGPISCAVHLPDPSDIHTLCDFVQDQNRKNKIFKELVTLHVMLEKPSPEFGYPINRMRNLALKNIDTQYFFIVDVDFMPRASAHRKLLKFFSTKSNAEESVKKLYVLPAFEVFGEGSDRNIASVTSLEDVPNNKTQLLAMLAAKKIEPFHMDYHSAGHGRTNYGKWYTCPKDTSYPISYSWMFEPYVVGSLYGIPRFNEKLRGFGLNKLAWVAEVHLQGYQLEVLCDHFVVHMNHPGRKERRPGNSRPAIDWYQKTYLPGRYNVTDFSNLRKIVKI